MDWQEDEPFYLSKTNEYRVSPTQSQSFPYNCIGLLRIHGDRMRFGTAFLISHNLLLTNAHIITPFPNETIQIEFFPSLNGDLTSSSHWATACRYPQQFTDSKSFHERIIWDYALLKLQTSIDRSQYLTFKPDFHNTQVSFSIAGYTSSGMLTLNGQLKSAVMSRSINSEPVRYNLGVIEHQLLVSPGLSGAPLLAVIDQNPRVIGIHKCGKHDNSSGLGVHISSHLLANISGWCLQLTGNPLVGCD